jgi:hypothetical protein
VFFMAAWERVWVFLASCSLREVASQKETLWWIHLSCWVPGAMEADLQELEQLECSSGLGTQQAVREQQDLISSQHLALCAAGWTLLSAWNGTGHLYLKYTWACPVVGCHVSWCLLWGSSFAYEKTGQAQCCSCLVEKCPATLEHLE